MNQSDVLSIAASDAVAGMSFCAVWPMAQGILNGVLPSIANPTLKTAVTALIAAANAVCNSSASTERLAKFSLVAPPEQASFLAGLTDNELQVLSNVQRNALEAGVIKSADVGGYFF